MYYFKQGFPEEGEIVLCSVVKVQGHAVFCDLDEYRKQGMIHISEIAPGRIRNIRDYVREGKKIVCKVLKVRKDRGHIDLSLRRVNDNQRRLKLEEIKQEQVAEKIIETVAKKLNKEFADFYKEIAPPLLNEYGMLHYAFNDVVQNDASLVEVGINKKDAVELEKEIRSRIQPPEVKIKGTLSLTSYAPDGVEIVKEGLAALLECGTEEVAVDITYAGAGKYLLQVTAPDYKQAEAVLKEATSTITSHMEKQGGTAVFKRQEQ